MAQSVSRSSANASSIGGSAEVKLGGFVFEAGARLALEIVHEGDADCFPNGVLIERLRLVDEGGAVQFEEEYAPTIDAAAWIGRVRLIDAGGLPLPAARYEVVITTNVGSFVAEVEVAATSNLQRLGRYSASASVCGYALRVYRLVSESDEGASLALRVGDRVMVELEGNATTGYTWTNAMEVEYAVLRETREAEYRPASDLLGASGVFLFRYVAVDIGPQTFRFIYHRPWEAAAPLKALQFSVNVL
ncbi:MAG: protease inhibitor I42 family protein [Candidatus Bipolaricaulis sp.]|nr:protease inhibitor I42 family protein [Candidatus Bipolaricaulis sp.]MDD5645818.1 protease inhibitor I42 family protein [Candidatus Bipolaricaulis sp.]